MRLNTKPVYQERTHEGAPAFAHLTPEQQLRRSVLSCLLWEDEFYEDGKTISDRIVESAGKVPPHVLANLAIEARTSFNLRHVPLLLLTVLCRTGSGSSLVSETIAKVIQRADELTEFLVIYAKVNGVAAGSSKVNGTIVQGGLKKKLSAQAKLGLAMAFKKFNPYQLAKYNRDGVVKMRDVLFLVHPSPDTVEQADLWKKLANDNVEAPDTWEVALSAGKDKKETFERLLRDGKLGYMALLRNLRGMTEAKVDTGLIRDAIIARKGADRVLPFRYVAAARAAPQFEPFLDQALSEAISMLPVLPGKTVVLVDVSGSMDAKLSGKSDMMRLDAAAALASIIPGDVRVFSFSHNLVECPPRRGMAGIDAIRTSQPHGGTYLGAAVATVAANVEYDRLIVITDEQSHDRVDCPKAARNYMVNVASNTNGVGYGKWVHLDGFSEHILRYIVEYESAGIM